MPNEHPVSMAETLARRLFDERDPADRPIASLLTLARRFSTFEFSVPETADADGHIFQYGMVNWLPESTFVLSVERQLEAVSSRGEHEHFSQVGFELRYAPTLELEALGSHSEWWFPGDGPVFETWLSALERKLDETSLKSTTPREFTVTADRT